uniref:Uncharacterized protein n=1 Tax=Anguilla anguilla TaxID=7936 RepID=A0A0E9XZ85_ANGAN
MRILVAPK